MVFKIKPKLNLTNIHSILSQDVIWAYILGHSNFDKPFKIRKESSPSATMYIGSSGDILLKDWGDPSQLKPESWWNYMARVYYNNSITEALNEINNVFNLGLQGNKKITSIQRNKPNLDIVSFIKESAPIVISIKANRKGDKIHYTAEDLAYWKQYGINEKMLRHKLVIPINRFWINDYCFYVKDITYAYIGLGTNLKGIEAIKIYSPGNYWYGNTDSSLVFNKNYIDKEGDLLIIQTSYKDIMCMEGLGYKNIIAPNSESTFFSNWEELKLKFKTFIYFANNDYKKKENPGINYANVIKKTYNINYISTPDNTASDISDYYKKYGRKATERLLNSLL